jgi:hypothetical protein
MRLLPLCVHTVIFLDKGHKADVVPLNLNQGYSFDGGYFLKVRNIMQKDMKSRKE